MKRLLHVAGPIGLVLAVLAVPGCQTLQEVAALRNVRFSINRVGGAALAGVDLDRVRSYSDLRPTDVLGITTAVAQRRLPLSFDLHLRAENPQENSVQARMVKLDWTLLLDDTETVSGVFDQNIVLPPGQPQDVPIKISLDLMQFFNNSARDLVELALAATGQGGQPKRISLRATPTVDTPIGPVRYPDPITIVSQEVGS